MTNGREALQLGAAAIITYTLSEKGAAAGNAGEAEARRLVRFDAASAEEGLFMRISKAFAWICASLALLAAVRVAAWSQVTLKPIEGDPVRIDSGLVSGTYLASGIKAYFGIAFAAPPVRENRWRAPQPVKPWTGVLTANRMQAECPQSLRDSDINHYFGEEAVSEDCLYMNIWAPATAKPGAKLPVVVWIYGGGFTGGSSGMAIYGGEPLAKKGVVYVNFNYRVGILGFLAHPQATNESGHNASGDWGLLDEVAALQWVQKNIAKFGGDPANVTITGQSAGSMSVNYLQASPLAKGLFAKAFGESGGIVSRETQQSSSPLANAEANGVKLQEQLKVKSLAEMRAFSWDKIRTAATTARVNASAIVDGYFLPKPAREIYAAHEQNDVPVIAGWTANDGGTATAIRRAQNLAEYKAAAAQMYGTKAEEFLQLWPAQNDEEAKAQAESVGRSTGFGASTRQWIEANAATAKSPSWLYIFSKAHTYAPGVVIAGLNQATAGAYHMSDTPFWLDTMDTYNMFRTTRAWTAADLSLAKKMSDVLVAFARTGDPSTPAVKMPKYNARDEQIVEFGDTIKVVNLNTKGLDFIANTPAAGGRGGRGEGGPY